MEKLFITLTLLLFACQITFAQDSLCVFKVKGTVTKNNKNALLKGRTIHKNEFVVVAANSEFIAIDNIGSIYVVNKSGKHSFLDLLTFKKSKVKSNLTTQYFKYIWAELTHDKPQGEAKAVVFRGNNLMTYPPDKSMVYSNKIILEWISDPQSLYYVFIRNKSKNAITKIETNGSHLGFDSDNTIFDNEKDYEWSVTANEFPNLKNITFYSFTIITQNEYKESIKQQQPLIEEFRELGLDENEINYEICISSGLCNGANKK